MDGQTSSGSVQPTIPPSTGSSGPAATAQGVPQVQPPSAPPLWYKTILQKLETNRSLALFLAMMILSLGMGTYIMVAPSSKTLPRPAAFSQVIPTTLPTAVPTQSPTIAPTLIPTASVILITEHPTPTPTAVPTPTPTPDPTLGWDTYVNPIYGYTIKYPLNWTATDLGELEPQVPSYIVFNPDTASSSARSITISASTRTYEEQLTINGSPGSPFYIASILGTWQNRRDSDGNTSVVVTLPRTGTILILRAKTAHVSTLNQMLLTLSLSN